MLTMTDCWLHWTRVYIGIKGAALIWFESHLNNRTEYFAIKYVHSRMTKLKYVVLQGSVLGLMLFTTYLLPQGDIEVGVQFHCFADDAKLNAYKTKMIIVSSPYFGAQTHNMINDLNGQLIHQIEEVRNLIVIFDNTINMESHNHKVCKTAYIHLHLKKYALYHTRWMRVLSTCLHNFKTWLCKYHIATWSASLQILKLN